LDSFIYFHVELKKLFFSRYMNFLAHNRVIKGEHAPSKGCTFPLSSSRTELTELSIGPSKLPLLLN
jgi:hypothetical protein